MSTVTCHTEGCSNADVPLDLALEYEDPDTGDTVRVGSVVCGVCGHEITDVA